MLEARGALARARVLDLFAGTGALGLEALSRGAEHCTFVETGRVGLRLLAENIRTLGAAEAEVLKVDATRIAACKGDAATLVFLDPPYGRDLGQKALGAARDGGWLGPGAMVVWEEAQEMEPPDGFDLLDRRRYRDTHLTLLGVPE